jgi:hypothetical protein
MQTVYRLGIFERLKHSIQLLACPPEVQLNLLPSFVCKADELALDFDHWRDVALRNFRSELTVDQLSCLDAIGRRFSELTRMGSEHWTEIAVRESTEWQGIRVLAGAALASFGWPIADRRTSQPCRRVRRGGGGARSGRRHWLVGVTSPSTP